MIHVGGDRVSLFMGLRLRARHHSKHIHAAYKRRSEEHTLVFISINEYAWQKYCE